MYNSGAGVALWDVRAPACSTLRMAAGIHIYILRMAAGTSIDIVVNIIFVIYFIVAIIIVVIVIVIVTIILTLLLSLSIVYSRN
jgi:hypothetical protein